MMKVLSFYGNFKLPDDFEGGLSDALRCCADYHDSVTAEGKLQKFTEPSEEGEVYRKKEWEYFLDAVERGKKFLATLSVSVQDGDKMVPLRKGEDL